MKTYGIIRLYNGRYAVVTSIEEREGHLVYYTHYPLNYSKKDFALKKAESFCRALYRSYNPQPILKCYGEIQL